jgi:hypothetical protein
MVMEETKPLAIPRPERDVALYYVRCICDEQICTASLEFTCPNCGAVSRIDWGKYA